MKDDKIYIKVFYNYHGNILCPWTYNVKDIENVEIQYSFNKIDWNIADKYDDFINLNRTQLMIFPYYLDPNKDYYFRILYNGEYTDILHINSDIELELIEGDHDGGDNYNQNIPHLTSKPDLPQRNSTSTGHGVKKIKKLIKMYIPAMWKCLKELI